MGSRAVWVQLSKARVKYKMGDEQEVYQKTQVSSCTKVWILWRKRAARIAWVQCGPKLRLTELTSAACQVNFEGNYYISTFLISSIDGASGKKSEFQHEIEQEIADRWRLAPKNKNKNVSLEVQVHL